MVAADGAPAQCAAFSTDAARDFSACNPVKWLRSAKLSRLVTIELSSGYTVLSYRGFSPLSGQVVTQC